MNVFYSIKEMTPIALVCLIIGLNIGKITGIAVIEFVLTAAFLAYVCATRQWNLLLCGVLFFVLSVGHFTSSVPVLTQIPALGILTMIIVSFLVILPFKAARTWKTWAKVGKINSLTILIMIGVGIISTIALIIWARWTDNLGIALKMADELKPYPKIIVGVLLIPVFAFLNSLAEEVVYRGVLQTALFEGFKKSHLVISLQATAFAALHFAVGFPNGISGYVMTFIYGIALGYLRTFTEGFMAPLICHVIADLTIFYYMANLVWKSAV